MSADAYPLTSSFRGFPQGQKNPNPNHQLEPQQQDPAPSKKRRNLPGTPDPDAEVIALSPKTLMATNRFVCEVCGKGFQREQNLQLHRRGHNLPWKLRQRSASAAPPRRKVYVCPEKSCVHNDPARALGDLTGVKKHFSRKHGEKRWKCERCQKRYAVKSDWKAHSKTCGTKEYKCDCGTIFSRKDSFITHRAFCDALTEESARLSSSVSAVAAATFGGTDLSFKSSNNSFTHNINVNNPHLGFAHHHDVLQYSNNIPQNFHHPSSILRQEPNNYLQGSTDASQDGDEYQQKTNLSLWLDSQANNNGMDFTASSMGGFPELLQMAEINGGISPSLVMENAYGGKERKGNHELGGIARGGGGGGGNLGLFSYTNQNATAHMSATALLQKAAQMGATTSSNNSTSPSPSTPFFSGFGGLMSSNKSENETQHNFQGILMNNNNNSVFGEMRRVSTDGEQQLPMTSKASPWGAHTRDFLGLGGEESGDHRPNFLQQELAKFASMAGSAGMDLMGPSYGTGKFSEHF